MTNIATIRRCVILKVATVRLIVKMVLYKVIIFAPDAYWVILLSFTLLRILFGLTQALLMLLLNLKQAALMSFIS